MGTFKFTLKICLLIAIGVSTYSATALDNELTQLLEISQTRLNATQLNGMPLNDGRSFELSSSTWLTGLPTVSLNYLGNIDNSDIYEQEASLNLPIKSYNLRQSDQQLRELTHKIQAQRVALQKLYLSGLLRQSMWDYHIASIKLEQLDRKTRLLKKLRAQQKRLADAGELPVVSLLLIDRERIDIDLEHIRIKQQQKEALVLYRSLTGLNEMPNKIIEGAQKGERGISSSLQGVNAVLIEHPLWQLQLLQRQQHLFTIKSQQAGAQEPWLLSLTVKKTSAEQSNDNHLGIGVSVPLGFGSALSQTELSTWQKDNQEQSQNSERTYLELKTQIEKLVIQQQNLQAQQALLQQGLSLSRTITEDLAKLKDQSHVGYETWLRRYIDALDTESRLILNQAYQQQLHSQQLQALGISL